MTSGDSLLPTARTPDMGRFTRTSYSSFRHRGTSFEGDVHLQRYGLKFYVSLYFVEENKTGKELREIYVGTSNCKFRTKRFNREEGRCG